MEFETDPRMGSFSLSLSIAFTFPYNRALSPVGLPPDIHVGILICRVHARCRNILIMANWRVIMEFHGVQETGCLEFLRILTPEEVRRQPVPTRSCCPPLLAAIEFGPSSLLRRVWTLAVFPVSRNNFQRFDYTPRLRAPIVTSEIYRRSFNKDIYLRYNLFGSYLGNLWEFLIVEQGELFESC